MGYKILHQLHLRIHAFYWPDLMKATIITNLIILVFCSCKAQQDDGKTFHRNYTIGDIPGKSDFMKLTKQERTADSIFSSSDRTIDSLIRLNDGLKDHALALRQSFVANRGRIYLQAFENGKSKEVDQVLSAGCRRLASAP